ncbi:MAG TPA: gliding motility-associated C-terminal domain-containing protein [Flavobacteriaceae bacterium]|nr:gliding motility-associated C-terminal domain-containing protein [Flavobacteriaceae bacterium]
MIKKLLFFFLLITSISVTAQKQAANWYFGYGAGLDFNSGTPVVLTNGQDLEPEGCAAISNSLGELLFYTDGEVIYNANHQLMQNGTGLLGHHSSTQSVLIVPNPGDLSQYYVFTTDAQLGGNGLRYSLVDMDLDSGLGGVIPSTKNILMEAPVTEKLAGVLHDNKNDIWIIAHRVNTNEFIAYLVTANGVSNSPVTSQTGEIHLSGMGINGMLGYLKISPNGKKIACCKFNTGGGLELFDFNASTGIVSNPQKLNSYNSAYGVEFSPNSKVLYCTSKKSDPNYRGVFQYDITLPDTQSIRNSETLISSGLYFALQLGIDGKIYVPKYSSFVSVIDNPNLLGIACDFQLNTIDLLTGSATLGLPNFISSYFLPLNKTIYTCAGNPLVLESRYPNANSYTWYEYDNNTSAYVQIPNETTMSLGVATAGIYKLVAIDSLGAVTEEIYTVYFSANPIVDLGPASACAQNEILLDGALQNPNEFGNVTYTWFFEGNIVQQGNQSTFLATNSGIYSVEVSGEILDENGNPTGEFCTTTDEINITNFTVDLGIDKMLCDENEYTLVPIITGEDEANASYLWNTSATTPTIPISASGIYTVTVTIDNCSVTESVEIIFNESPKFDLGDAISSCDLNKLNLILDATPSNFTVSETTFEWFFNGSLLTSETGPTLLVDQYGTYSVNAYANDPNCSNTQETNIIERSPISVSLTASDDDNLFCPEETVVLSTELLNASFDEVTFSWYRNGTEILGQTGSNLLVQISETTSLTTYSVKIEVDECVEETQIKIGRYENCTIPQGISPNGDPYNQNFDLSFLNIADLQIFNRNGRLVFHKENGYKNEWEGLSNEGKALPTGTYYYIITLEKEEVFLNKHVLTGWVYLNREIN